MKSLDSLTTTRRLMASFAIGSLALIAACQDSVSPDRVVLPHAAAQGLAFGSGFGDWSPAVNVQSIPGTHVDFNTVATDGCPFEAPDGKTFYMASNRAGGVGNLDIWVSTRSSADGPWGQPVNVAAVNSVADDFCPTMSRDGKTLYFVSRRGGGCGMGDIYVARQRADGLAFETPELLPCDDTSPHDAVNSQFDEFSPFLVQEPGVGPTLYFSSFRPGGFDADASDAAGDSDIYRSASHGGVFGAAELLAGINTAADDGQPNVGSDGLELFFYSTRVTTPPGPGGADIFVATRDAPNAPWSTPGNLGSTVNSSANETRPSLSWDGTTLYFGSTRAGGEGMQDIYVSTRRRLNPGGN